MRIKLVISIISAFLGVVPTLATAATVSATNSVSFALDVSASAIDHVYTIGFSCVAGIDPDCDISGEPERLADGASLTFSLGTSAGASDLYSSTFTNTLGTDFGALTVGQAANSIGVHGNTVWLTFSFVDDIVDIHLATLVYHSSFEDGHDAFVVRSSAPIDVPANAVPLPAGLPLVLTGLAGLLFLGRRKI